MTTTQTMLQKLELLERQVKRLEVHVTTILNAKNLDTKIRISCDIRNCMSADYAYKNILGNNVPPDGWTAVGTVQVCPNHIKPKTVDNISLKP